MTTDDNVKIEINIAGESILLTVPYGKQSAVRRAENAVNELLNDWRGKFPRKRPGELLAMVAYQYASNYYDLQDKTMDALHLMEGLSGQLDEIIDSPD